MKYVHIINYVMAAMAIGFEQNGLATLASVIISKTEKHKAWVMTEGREPVAFSRAFYSGR